MLAVTCVRQCVDDPLSGLEIGERPEPGPRDGWVAVTLRAASLNHHDLWSLRGVGLPPDRLPMVLGTDGAGVTDDGREVVCHSVVASPGWAGDETYDPRRSLLSEVHDGTLAERVLVPERNLVDKPADLPWEVAACLPTAWLTAYRMLATNSGAQPGGLVLVQGAGGGVATACVQLGVAMGLRMWVTSRSGGKRERAVALGAERAYEPGARLPEKVDAVIETVGAATWSHSVNVLRPGGSIVICGATSGDAPERAELSKIFFRQLRVVGSTMGNRDELQRLVALVATRGLRPVVDTVLPLADARRGFERLLADDLYGKVVLTAG